MNKISLGSTDMKITPLGFGAAFVGLRNISQRESELLFNSVLDEGINYIDTAECYGNCEDLIGKSISNRRQDFYIFSKCGHSSGLDGPDWNFKMMEESVDRSLRRLRVDSLDLLQLHSCPMDILLKGEVFEFLALMKKKGKARYIGCSADGNAALVALNSNKIDVLQTSINIADQEAIEKVLPTAIDRSVGVLAKRPLANAVWNMKDKPDDIWYHAYWDRIRVLDYPFIGSDAENSVLNAIRFVLSVPGVSGLLVGSTNIKHIQRNIHLAKHGPLTEDDYWAIRARWIEVGGKEWPSKG